MLLTLIVTKPTVMSPMFLSLLREKKRHAFATLATLRLSACDKVDGFITPPHLDFDNASDVWDPPPIDPFASNFDAHPFELNPHATCFVPKKRKLVRHK